MSEPDRGLVLAELQRFREQAVGLRREGRWLALEIGLARLALIRVGMSEVATDRLGVAQDLHLLADSDPDPESVSQLATAIDDIQEELRRSERGLSCGVTAGDRPTPLIAWARR